MTAILNALTELHQSLELLELASAEQEQKSLQTKQQDLFNGHKSIDPAVWAQKLDVTIERVEQILKEA